MPKKKKKEEGAAGFLSSFGATLGSLLTRLGKKEKSGFRLI